MHYRKKAFFALHFMVYSSGSMLSCFNQNTRPFILNSEYECNQIYRAIFAGIEKKS